MVVSLTSTAPVLSVSTRSDIYCAVPSVGLTVYSGTYSLDFAGKSLDLGKMEFVSGTNHDGYLRVYKLLSEPAHDFLALYQYGNCTLERLSLYGWDDAAKQPIRYTFKKPNGITTEELWISGILPNTAENLVTEFYDNIRGEFITSHWKLNQLTNTFEKV